MSFPRRLETALHYNEQKVQRGVADCVGAVGYLREGSQMDYHQKLQVLAGRNELNWRAETKTLHVSLNFHPAEQFSEERLLAIAAAYMEQIGFGEQPYLVYRHRDAGHPHLHVVSTLIRPDGTRIPTHNLGRGASERARKAVEQAFGLVAAGRGKEKKDRPVPEMPPEKVRYGRSETKQSIARVVHFVATHYRFTSLDAYNAALKAFNVLADRGREGSRTRSSGGLVYRVLNEQGEKVGVPVKASDLPGSPTLAWLRQRFAENSKKLPAPADSLQQKPRAGFSGAASRCGDHAGVPGKQAAPILSLCQKAAPPGAGKQMILTVQGLLSERGTTLPAAPEFPLPVWRKKKKRKRNNR